ncbi:MAG: Sec-dependent nitrous-oxide reductase [Candidatus Kapabacteria bacterium]|nr:Sec-dependent nitrous-oxide reductase [Candidatus Kapabacteria bacterium]
MKKSTLIIGILASMAFVLYFYSCSSKDEFANDSDAASKVYVAPGEHDELYGIFSGGFNGQMSIYGLPSGRLLRIIPVFSQHAENGWGYSEETKPMLETSHGFVPWDDAHHPELSMTDGVHDGRWAFINGNNTPRIARIDLTTFKTTEIIEIPNSSGNHSSPFATENTEYVIAGTRFSVPIPNKDVSIETYKENFKGAISFVKVDSKNGRMSIGFQILMPGFDYDLSSGGRGVSKDWAFFTCYNSEMANTLLEVNASQNDKDYIAAINWKLAEKYIAEGKFKEVPGTYRHNVWNEETHSATSTEYNTVKMLNPADCPGLVYLLPTPKSPHGCDVDPSGEYIVGSGKLAALIPVFSYSKMIKAIEAKKFDNNIDGIPVLNYDAVLAGEVEKPGLGPLHTQFDGEGFAYTSMFLSSEIVKWKIGTWEVVDRIPTYYSIGHLMIPGGGSKKPYGKYVIALNKITKDRYLPTGPELTHAAQLYDITGNKMKLLLDFPTTGEPHYAQAIPAELIAKNSKKIYKLEDNKHPYVTKSEKDAKVVREGKIVRVYMTTIRSHFIPDMIEGIKVGDEVYFHVTNLEQDWDVPHGFAIIGALNSELLLMPGETATIKWIPKKEGIHPFYCTDFCSALHQEMQGYIRVSPANSNVEIKFNAPK